MCSLQRGFGATFIMQGCQDVELLANLQATSQRFDSCDNRKTAWFVL